MNKMHILAIAAHPDDIELGCSGTIMKHTAKGDKVAILDLTEGELGTRGTPTLRYEEAAAAAEIMGVSDRKNAQLRDGFFTISEDSIKTVIQFIRYWQPEIVIANAFDDRHPDHGRGCKLIEDACFLSGLLKVETEWEGDKQLPWRPKRIFHMIQDRFTMPNFVVDISDVWDKKIAAIKAYKSQFYDPNSSEQLTYIATPEFFKEVESRSNFLGKTIGAKYGEGFHTKNVIGFNDLDAHLLPVIS